MANKKPVIKVNSNPNKTPAKSISKSSAANHPQQKTNWNQHAWDSREGTGEYGQPTFNNKGKIKPIKINSNPVKTSGLSGRGVGEVSHMGGHAPISGVTIKTPAAPKTGSAQKTPVKPNISIKNK